MPNKLAAFTLIVFVAIVMSNRHPATADEPQNNDDPQAGHRLYLDEFRPKSMLKVATHTPARAKFPVVDVHTHFAFKLQQTKQAVEDYVRLMDRNHIAVCISLDGQLNELAEEQRKLLWTEYQNRFVIFVHFDFQGTAAAKDFPQWDCNQPDFSRRVAMKLKSAKALGISGVKVFKSFGLQVRNADGSLARIDDPRWDPIWAACGELGLPVLIHTGDPAAFFLPVDATNERWEELQRHPDWSFHGQDFPSRQELLEARNRVIARHPRTLFIGAHVANNSEDLGEVSRWLDQYPNLYVDFASRIGELGRQPYTAREFIQKYQDRVLFGTDGPWPETRVRLYWRFLETRDEYFPYSEKPFPPQGFWNIYGLGLEDAVLRKVYADNAARIIPGVRQRLDRLAAER